MLPFPSTIRGRTHIFLATNVLIGMLASPFLYSFIKLSLQEGYSSQSVLVPFISLYLIWEERRRIFSTLDYSVAGGVVLSGLAMAAFFTAGVISRNAQIVDAVKLAGVLGMIIGAFVGCYGRHALRAAVFPICFLLFMLPLPSVIIDKVIVFLQYESAALCYQLFSWAGIPVLRDGVRLAVPGVTIEVAKECSGINSSMALLMMAVLVAHQTLRTSSRRTLLVLLTIPLSIIKNAVRIVVLTLLALYVDPSFLTGHLHHQGGFVFFFVAIGLVYPLWKVLQKTEVHNETVLGSESLVVQSSARGSV